MHCLVILFSANTPNGWKISIMLEEIGYEYKVTKVDLGKDEQFNPEFKNIAQFAPLIGFFIGIIQSCIFIGKRCSLKWYFWITYIFEWFYVLFVVIIKINQ